MNENTGELIFTVSKWLIWSLLTYIGYKMMTTLDIHDYKIMQLGSELNHINEKINPSSDVIIHEDDFVSIYRKYNDANKLYHRYKREKEAKKIIDEVEEKNAAYAMFQCIIERGKEFNENPYNTGGVVYKISDETYRRYGILNAEELKKYNCEFIEEQFNRLESPSILSPTKSLETKYPLNKCQVIMNPKIEDGVFSHGEKSDGDFVSDKIDEDSFALPIS